MTCYELQPEPSETQHTRGFICGAPPLPTGSDWPTCRICGDPLVHFIDVELPDEGSAPFQKKSRLQIFACRQHDDIAGTIYSGYDAFNSANLSRQLPPEYWKITDGHYMIRLLAPVTPMRPSRDEARLVHRSLRFSPNVDSMSEPLMSMKLFGCPSWAQDPEEHICCCGAPMRLILQIPEGVGFEKSPSAPAQPNTFSNAKYCLFLSNELYLLACERQCHPMALWPTLQHT